VPTLEVTVDRGDIDARALLDSHGRVAHELRCKGDLAGALALTQKAQALAPDDPQLQHYLAYMLAICPDPKLRDAERAVELAKKAVAAAQDKWEFWSTLGVANHFAGDDRAAVKALARSLDLHQSGHAFVYFALAAAHQKLGNKEEALKWYERGPDRPSRPARNKAAGESPPPSRSLTGPASPRRSVCAPGALPASLFRRHL
jgi:tetratricopeptide (TPR) repeat protein